MNASRQHQSTAAYKAMTVEAQQTVDAVFSTLTSNGVPANIRYVSYDADTGSGTAEFSILGVHYLVGITYDGCLIRLARMNGGLFDGQWETVRDHSADRAGVALTGIAAPALARWTDCAGR